MPPMPHSSTEPARGGLHISIPFDFYCSEMFPPPSMNCHTGGGEWGLIMSPPCYCPQQWGGRERPTPSSRITAVAICGLDMGSESWQIYFCFLGLIVPIMPSPKRAVACVDNRLGFIKRVIVAWWKFVLEK